MFRRARFGEIRVRTYLLLSLWRNRDSSVMVYAIVGAVVGVIVIAVAVVVVVLVLRRRGLKKSVFVAPKYSLIAFGNR